MTVTSDVSENRYVGSGIAGPFAYGFKIFAATDLTVIETTAAGIPSTLVLGVDYTVTDVGNPSGGTVTLLHVLPGNGIEANSSTLSIARSLVAVQTLDLRNQGPFFAEAIERAFDRVVMLIQQIWRSASRSLRLPAGEPTSDVTTVLPPLALRKGRSLMFDPTTGAPGVGAVSDTTVSAAMIPVVQASTLAQARAALGPHDDLPLTDVTTGNASTSKHGFLAKLQGTSSWFLNGLNQWTARFFGESVHSSSPNDSVPAHSLFPSPVGTDADICIVPKGVGSLMLAVPDGTSVGGNKRGTYAVDLQFFRGNGSHVASGPQSFLGSGANNSAGGDRSACVAGSGNNAGGDDSICFGRDGLVSTQAPMAMCHGSGGYARHTGERVHGAYSTTMPGLCQHEELVATKTTTDATPSALFPNAALDSNTFLMAINEAAAVSVSLTGYQDGGTNNAAAYQFNFAVKCGATLASTVLVGAVTTLSTNEDNAAWGFNVTVDAFGGVNINAIGAAATTIRWVASVRITRVKRA